MLNLGFVQMRLPPLWAARFDPQSSQTSLHFLDGLARASLNFYSAGTESFEGNFEKFFEELSNSYRLNGLHFDDLSEEFNSELLVELPSPDRSPFFQHTFLRLVHDIIVRMDLLDYRPEDEEAARDMMSTLQRGEEINTAPLFKPLEILIENQDWDQTGDIAVYNGGY